MSSRSRSGSKGHYPNQNHGGEHYKRPNSPGGILGKIIAAVKGSKRHSQSDLDHDRGHSSNRHHRKSSWS